MNKIIMACIISVTMLTGLSTPTIAKENVKIVQTKKTKQTKNKIKIIDSGYYVIPANEYIDTTYVYYWAKVKNMDKKKSIQFPQISVTAKDDAGKVLGSSSQTTSGIAPKETVVLTSQMDTGSSIPATVEIKTKKPHFINSKYTSTKLFKVNNITTVPAEDGLDKVTGEVVYNGKKDLDMVGITAVYKFGDTSVFAETTYLNDVESKTTEAFEVDPLLYESYPEYDNVEVYVQDLS